MVEIKFGFDILKLRCVWSDEPAARQRVGAPFGRLRRARLFRAERRNAPSWGRGRCASSAACAMVSEPCSSRRLAQPHQIRPAYSALTANSPYMADHLAANGRCLQLVAEFAAPISMGARVWRADMAMQELSGRQIAAMGAVGGLLTAFSAATLYAGAPALAAEEPKCAETDTGIALPKGFCATVFADKIGHARQMAVAGDGTVFVNTWSGVYYNNDTPARGRLPRRAEGHQGRPARPITSSASGRRLPRAARAAPASTSTRTGSTPS